MADRIKGITPFSWNFEVQAAWPLDARFISETRADLLTPTNWDALDWNEYLYKGMPVSVHSDPNTDFNWIYILLDVANYTDINSRAFLQAGEAGWAGITDVRLIENSNNLIIDWSWAGVQQQADWTNINDDDVIAIFGQTTPMENGIYMAMSNDDEAWTRVSSFSTWASVSSKLFKVDQWINSADSLRMITNDEWSDVVDTNVLTTTRIDSWSMVAWDWVMTEPAYWTVRTWNSVQGWVNYWFQSIDSQIALYDWTDAFGYHEIGETITPDLRGTATNGANPTSTNLTLQFFEGGDSWTWTQVWADVDPATSGVEYTQAGTSITTDTEFSALVTDDQVRTNETTWRHRFSFPFFANSVAIATMTSQTPLVGLKETFYECTCVAETDVVWEKHTVEFSEDNTNFHGTTDWSPVTWVQFYNTVSWARERLNWNKTASLTSFTRDSGTYTETIQWNTIDYVRYTHNGIKCGERQYRFFTD